MTWILLSFVVVLRGNRLNRAKVITSVRQSRRRCNKFIIEANPGKRLGAGGEKETALQRADAFTSSGEPHPAKRSSPFGAA